MSRGRVIAQWFRRGRLWVVQPPGWPKNVELSFTDQGSMVRWAHGNGIVLRDITPTNGGRYGRVAARDTW